MFTELLINNNKINKDMEILKLFLDKNEYDSDTFKYDIDDWIENENENNSNIIIMFQKRSEMLSQIKQHIKNYKGM